MPSTLSFEQQDIQRWLEDVPASSSIKCVVNYRIVIAVQTQIQHHRSGVLVPL
jgi:hypothetical protein